jgi:hypothetical protein
VNCQAEHLGPLADAQMNLSRGRVRHTTGAQFEKQINQH